MGSNLNSYCFVNVLTFLYQYVIEGLSDICSNLNSYCLVNVSIFLHQYDIVGLSDMGSNLHLNVNVLVLHFLGWGSLIVLPMMLLAFLCPHLHWAEQYIIFNILLTIVFWILLLSKFIKAAMGFTHSHINPVVSQILLPSKPSSANAVPSLFEFTEGDT